MPPVVQQARVGVMPRPNRSHAGARLLRLGDNPQLLLKGPAASQAMSPLQNARFGRYPVFWMGDQPFIRGISAKACRRG